LDKLCYICLLFIPISLRKAAFVQNGATFLVLLHPGGRDTMHRNGAKPGCKGNF